MSVVPGAGFFLDLPTVAGDYSFRAWMKWVYTTMNVTGSVNDRCEGHYVPLGEGWRCLFSPDMLPFIATPRVFVANFMADSAQQEGILALGCAHQAARPGARGMQRHRSSPRSPTSAP